LAELEMKHPRPSMLSSWKYSTSTCHWKMRSSRRI
jgi:hypothetical protein